MIDQTASVSGTAKVDLKAFPDVSRQEAGHQLFRVQCGLAAEDFKPMQPSVEVSMKSGFGNTAPTASSTSRSTTKRYTSSTRSKSGRKRPNDGTSSVARHRLATHQNASEARVDNRIHESSGNVFLDLGFSPKEAERLLLRSRFAVLVEQVIKSRRLTQARAAKLFE